MCLFVFGVYITHNVFVFGVCIWCISMMFIHTISKFDVTSCVLSVSIGTGLRLRIMACSRLGHVSPRQSCVPRILGGQLLDCYPTYLSMCLLVCLLAWLCVWLLAYARMHLLMHARTHAQIHTNPHTYISCFLSCFLACLLACWLTCLLAVLLARSLVRLLTCSLASWLAS